MKERTYISIDLKSFYASVECKDRELDPMDTNLVVADESRTDKTICLAVTPSLKSYGISGRGRLFEVRQRVREANAARQQAAPGHRLTGASVLPQNWRLIRPWRWISSLRRRGWLSIWSAAGRFTAFI